MNASYLAIVLWIGSLIVQFFAYLYLAARQRGRDEAKLAEIAEQEKKIGLIEITLVSHSLRLENIITYLESKNGFTFRRQ